MEAIGVDKLERYINDYDVILVGPQLSHKYDFIKKLIKSINRPPTNIRYLWFYG